VGFSFMDARSSPQEFRTFFVTFVTAQRRSIFQVDRNVELLLDVLRSDREKRRYCLHAWVVMPDHVHLLLTPAVDVPLEKAVQFIKGGFSFRLKSVREVWQQGYTEHRIQDADDFERHVEYIVQNPVRAGLGDDYAWSHLKHPKLIDPRPVHFDRRAQG
jgi:putative transposase